MENELEAVSDIKQSVDTLNRRISAAADLGISVELDMIDITTICNKVKVIVVNPRIFKEF